MATTHTERVVIALLDADDNHEQNIDGTIKAITVGKFGC
jgi:hypothetical protein